MDDASLNRRAKFSISVKFASIINSVQNLSSIWQTVAPAQLTAPNFIMQTNYKLLENGNLSSLNTIVPYGGFPASIKTFTKNEGDIQVVFDPLLNATRFDLSAEKTISLSVILFLSSPLPGAPFESQLVSLPQVSKTLQLENEETFNVPLTKLENDFISKYADMRLYMALTTLNDSGTVINYSQTIFN